MTTSLLQPVRGFEERSRSFTAALGVEGWLTSLVVMVGPVGVLVVDLAWDDVVDVALTDVLVLVLVLVSPPPPQPAIAAATRVAATAATSAAPARGR